MTLETFSPLPREALLTFKPLSLWKGKKGYICQLLYIKFIILEFLSCGENPSPRTGPLGPHCVSCGLLRHEGMALRCSVSK